MDKNLIIRPPRRERAQMYLNPNDMDKNLIIRPPRRERAQMYLNPNDVRSCNGKSGGHEVKAKCLTPGDPADER